MWTKRIQSDDSLRRNRRTGESRIRADRGGKSWVPVREAVQGDLMEYSYQTRLLRADSQQYLMDEIRKLPDVEEPNLLMQRSSVEI